MRPGPVFLFFLVICPPCITSEAQPQVDVAPVFSFWRNLVLHDQVHIPLEYSRDLLPVSPDTAARCCAVRPGDTFTLVKRNGIVRSGEVGSIVAASVPRAGDDRVVYFDALNMADSSSAFRGPPTFPRPDERDYELYVVGDFEVSTVEPAARLWAESKDAASIIEGALTSRVIRKADLGYLAWETARLSGREISRSVQLDSLVNTLSTECELAKYSIAVGDADLVVHSCQRRTGRWGPYFVCVSGVALVNAEYFRGEIDFFVRVENDVYMVLRDVLFGTGAWAYRVFKFRRDDVPIEVHADGSWST